MNCGPLQRFDSESFREGTRHSPVGLEQIGLPRDGDGPFQTDLASTYQYHKRFLQLLQAWAHRDPLTVTGSFWSLMKMGAQAFGLNPDIECSSATCPHTKSSAKAELPGQ